MKYFIKEEPYKVRSSRGTIDYKVFAPIGGDGRVACHSSCMSRHDAQQSLNGIRENHIRTANPSDEPMADTEYHQWVESNGDGHRINDLTGYLSDYYDFVKGVDKLDSGTLQTLQHIHSHYYWKKYHADKSELGAYL
jgi:hypothetical protein